MARRNTALSIDTRTGIGTERWLLMSSLQPLSRLNARVYLDAGVTVHRNDIIAHVVITIGVLDAFSLIWDHFVL
jgi:hypothetical protein